MTRNSLSPEKIAATTEQLSHRIGERFPEGGLYEISLELLQLGEKARAAAPIISRPIYAVRIGVGILIAAVVALLVSLVWVGLARIDEVDGANLADVVSALEAGTSELVLDPAFYRQYPGATKSSAHRQLTIFELIRYLDYCSELLSLTSKLPRSTFNASTTASCSRPSATSRRSARRSRIRGGRSCKSPSRPWKAERPRNCRPAAAPRLRWYSYPGRGGRAAARTTAAVGGRSRHVSNKQMRATGHTHRSTQCGAGSQMGTNGMRSRTVFAASILGALLCVCRSALAQGGFGPAELTLVPVRDSIYVIRNAGAGNVTMLVGQSAVILIDAKFPQDHERMMELVRSVTDTPVRYVISTHLHPDHVGGNPALQAIGADVIASENARRIMVERETPGLPNITIGDFVRIYLDDMPIDLHYLGRGHTDGDIVIHLPEERMLVAGDLFALYEPYRPVIDYSAGGSLRDWTRTLERVLELDFDTVIPGHSGLTDRANVQGYLAELTRIQETVREMNRQRRSREEIQAVLETEFNWGRLEMLVGLDGVITEMQ